DLRTQNNLAGIVTLTATAGTKSDITLGDNLVAGLALTIDGSILLVDNISLSGDGISLPNSVGIDADGFSLGLDGKSGSATPGSVSVTGPINNVNVLTLQDAAGATFSSTVDGSSISINSATTGTVLFSNAVTLGAGFSAAAGSFDLSLLGNGTSVNGQASFQNTKALILGDNDSDTLAFASGLSRNGSTFATKMQGIISFGGAATLTGVVPTNSTGLLNLTGDTLTLGFSTGSFGALTLTANGNVSLTAGPVGSTTLTIMGTSISQSGTATLAPSGLATLTATGNISLPLNNNFANVTFNGANVTLTDTNALGIAGPSSASGNLVLSTGGVISQSGKLEVTGTTSLAAGAANNITLADANNSFGGAVTVVSGLDVSLTDSSNLVLGTSTISGILTAQAVTGSISQSGALTVTGVTNLTVSSSDDVVLQQTTNNFKGAVTVTGATNVTLGNATDFTLNVANKGITSVSVSGDATVASSAATGLKLGNSAIGGSLNASSSAGDLVDSGVVTVGGTASFSTTTANSDITLDQTTVNGSVAFNTAGTTGNASFNTSGGISLAASTINGNLALTSPSAITQLVAITVTGTTNLTG
ncbi:MAG: hypothetical protein EBS30_16690, partial [Planctomycetes bacterium]|nr:hypothetical protein [Planctomycetota bacterium]